MKRQILLGLAILTLLAVTAGAQTAPPVLDPIGPKIGNEGTLVTFIVTASDVDATIPTLGAAPLPTGATFVDNLNGTGTFSWTPDFTQAGPYNITFFAKDAVTPDSVGEVVSFTISNVNQVPILATIGAQSIAEGAVLNFNISATDSDGSTPTFTTSALPTNATFLDNGDGTGTFNFAPDFTQAGSFNVTFRSTDGTDIDSEVVAITVTNVNQAPVLAAIGAQSIAEGAVLNFNISATDPDGSTPTFTTSALPTNATFLDNGDGTGTFNFVPDFTQAGPFSVTFRSTDGTDIDSEVVAITVTNVNQAPVLAAIGAKSVNEGAVLNFNISSTDPDGTTPTFTTSALPTNATFLDNGDGTGTFNFAPDFTQAGSYSVTFRSTDGTDIDSEVVSITVTGTNLAPVLAAIGPKSIAEGAVLNFNISATDPDLTTPTFTTSALPTNASFVDNGNGTGTFNFAPDFTQAGPFSVTFRTTDGTDIDSEVVAITVTNVNQAPVLAAIGAKSVNEGAVLNFNISATDPDGTTPTFTTSALPTNASFIDNGNGTGTFNFAPDFTQAGSYSVTFRSTDGTDIDSEVVSITVTGTNQTPVLAAIGPKSVNEGAVLNFNISATDPDLTTPTFTTSALPTNASFVDNGDGTGTFNFAPDFTQSGSFNLTFRATDGSSVDSEVVTITVTDVNRDPVLAAIGPQSVNEGVVLNFNVSATDPDLTTPTFTTSALPTNATFVDNGNGTGTFNFAPDFTQAGSFNVTFRSTDGSAVDSEVVTITVTDVNQPPVLATIGPKTVNEGQVLNFNITATDGDGTTPTFTTSVLPTNASFVDNGDGTGTFNFAPDFTQGGNYPITFRTSDGSLLDSETVIVSVVGINVAPVLAAIGPKSVDEGQALSFNVSATDANGTIPAIIADNLPLGAVFTDNLDGSGTLNFSPDFTQAGAFNVLFYATDGSLADSETVTITVTDVNRKPVLATIGDRTVDEAQVLNFNISATDPDGTTPTFTTSTLPTNGTFVDNGDGTGTFNFAPDFTQAGSVQVTFRAVDGSLVDSQVVTITVVNVDRKPVIATVGNRSVNLGNTLAFVVSASDPDGTSPTISLAAPLANATLVDNANGTANFSFTPSGGQVGTNNIQFIASDGTLADSQAVVITVSVGGNVPPVFAAVRDTAIDEGTNLTMVVSASDPDGGGSFPSLSVSTTLKNYTFVDNHNGTATLTYNPTFFNAGIDSVHFFATDIAAATVTTSLAVTTRDVNRPPAFAAVTSKTITVGDSLGFTVTATDSTDPLAPRRILLSALNTPSGSVFVDNANSTGKFSFVPTAAQIGTYTVTFLAVDQGTPPLSANLPVQIAVVAANHPPTLNLALNEARIIAEGQTLAVPVVASDVDGTVPVITAENLPANATLIQTGPGQASFSFTPSFIQGGSRSKLYTVIIKATDGLATTKSNVTIQVNDAGNQAPVWDVLPANVSVTEGDSILIRVHAYDPDTSRVHLSAALSTQPTTITFVDSGNGAGVLKMKPTFSQAGVYTIDLVATDTILSTNGSVTITVNDAGNQLPKLAAIADRTIREMQAFQFTVSASDPDGIAPVLYANNIPVGGTFVDSLNGKGLFTWATNNFDSGHYQVTFVAEDGQFPAVKDSLTVTLTVVDSNQTPFISVGSSVTMNEGDTLRYVVFAEDIDSTIPHIRASLNKLRDTLATNMTVVDSGNGVGTLFFTPSYTQGNSGTNFQIYFVKFFAVDQVDSMLVDTSTTIQIRVNNKNAPPVMAFSQGPGPFTRVAGDSVVFNITATDPDGGIPTITTSALPTNATFQFGALLSTFKFKPDFTQPGTYNILFTATDAQAAKDTHTVTITVTAAVNQKAKITTTLPDTLNVAAQVTSQLLLKAMDPERQHVTITANPILPTAVFVDSGNGAATYVINPTSDALGTTAKVTFIATDPAGAADTVVTTFRVVSFLRGDLNQDGKYTMVDLANLVSYLLRRGPAPGTPATADVNGDNRINLSDAAYLVNFLYNNGTRPPQ
ncbi:MAG: Ig-like domain-containing protein [Candidatus Zixiibacteriota bacterium]